MELQSAVMEAITSYTGLSPASFFTIAALMVVVYKTVCGMFVDPEEPPPASPQQPAVSEPIQLGDLTEEELRAFNGSDPKKPLLMAIKGQIYDVSSSRFRSFLFIGS